MERTEEVIKNGKTYRISKFSPAIACYWATKLFGDLIGSVAGGFTADKLPLMISNFTNMERSQFSNWQKDCLSFIEIQFESGYNNLVNSDGHLTVVDIPSPVLFELTIRSFMFSMKDFLDQSLLTGMLGAVIPDSNQTSKTSSSPQSDLNIGNTMTSGIENTL